MKRILTTWLLIALAYAIVYCSYIAIVSLINGSSITDSCTDLQEYIWMGILTVVPYIFGGVYIRKAKLPLSFLVIIGLMSIVTEKLIIGIILVLTHFSFMDLFPYFRVSYFLLSILSLISFIGVGYRSITIKRLFFLGES